MMRRLETRTVQVRKPQQLAGLDGLILPGGESTTMGLVAERWGWSNCCGLGAERPASLGHLCRADPAGRASHWPEGGRAAADWWVGCDGEPQLFWASERKL
jgi:hypothetical protein